MNLMNKKSGDDSKIWIIGDSFTGMGANEDSWQYLLYKKFTGRHIYVSSKGSRDVQTIFDIFLQNLYKMNSNDFVILLFPTLTRFRLPLEYSHIDVEWSSDLVRDKIGGVHMNSFIGNSAYTSQVSSIPAKNEKEEFHRRQFTLEWPLNHLNPNIFQANPNDKEQNFANITQLINSSKVMINNWNGILKSIQSYVPFKLLYYSWANELDSSVVNTRSVLTNQLGIWETLNDEYNKTNGQSGRKDDVHWSRDMNIKFAEHIIKSYPQYFSYDITKDI
jgi:hypothetical protein